MKKISIVVLVLAFYGCVVPVSIGNKSISEVENNKKNETNTVYTPVSYTHLTLPTTPPV